MDTTDYIGAMITSSMRGTWYGDVPLKASKQSGLTVDSIIRLKLFTLDQKLILKRIGKINEDSQFQIRTTLAKTFLV